MAEIVEFPDSAKRTDLEIRADIADALVKRGVAGDLAIKRAAKIVDEFREFERILNSQSVVVKARIDIALTDEVTRAVHETGTLVRDQAKDAWLRQRLTKV